MFGLTISEKASKLLAELQSQTESAHPSFVAAFRLWDKKEKEHKDLVFVLGELIAKNDPKGNIVFIKKLAEGRYESQRESSVRKILKSQIKNQFKGRVENPDYLENSVIQAVTWGENLQVLAQNLVKKLKKDKRWKEWF